MVALMGFSCSNHHEKEANSFLTKAQTSLEKGDFNAAKQLLDSIKIVYPKAFETRKKGIALLLKVQLKEQQVSLRYIDSMLVVQRETVAKNKRRFTLEKNAKYQEEGIYFYPSQLDHKNVHRTYLRAQVSEQGQFCLTGVYTGRRYLNHTKIKVMARDKTYAETALTSNTYKSRQSRYYTEKCDYTGEEAAKVAQFVALHQKEALTIVFMAKDKTVKKTMPKSDALGIAQVYHFSLVLASIPSLEKEKAAAQRKINFLLRKIQE